MKRERQKVRTRLTWAGGVFVLIAALIAGSSYIQRENLLVLMGGLLLAPGLLSMVLTRRTLLAVELARELPAEAFADAPFSVGLVLTNRRRRSTAYGITVQDRWMPEPPPPLEPVRFCDVPAGATVRQDYCVAAARRGVYRLGPASIGTQYPFGFFECRRSDPGTDELVVYPPLGTLLPAWRSGIGLSTQTARSRQQPRARSQDEFHGLRPYRDTDNPRHIHWRTSARRGELMVKEFEPIETFDMALVLEPWLPEEASVSERVRVELLASFAATVCVELVRMPGIRLLLAIAGEEWSFRHGSASARLLAECLRQLSLMRGSPAADLAAEPTDPLPLDLRNASGWAISTRPVADRVAHLAAWQGRSAAAGLLTLDISAGELERYFVPPTTLALESSRAGSNDPATGAIGGTQR